MAIAANQELIERTRDQNWTFGESLKPSGRTSQRPRVLIMIAPSSQQIGITIANLSHWFVKPQYLELTIIAPNKRPLIPPTNTGLEDSSHAPQLRHCFLPLRHWLKLWGYSLTFEPHFGHCIRPMSYYFSWFWDNWKIPPRGVEALKGNQQPAAIKRLTKNTIPVLSTSMDKILHSYTELQELVKVWPKLSEHTKTAIKTLVQTHGKEAK